MKIKDSHIIYSAFYKNTQKQKLAIAESFIARIFLSQNPIKLLKEYDFKSKTILDIGCGNGRHISFFNQLGFKTTGIEVDEFKVNELQKKFSNSLFSKATSDNLPNIWNNKFDYVAAINSIYYLHGHKNIGNNINEATRVLKPKGAFVCSFVGKQHFILENTERNTDNTVIIKNDPLNFRNGIKIRPVWSEEDLTSMIEHSAQLKIYKTGHIKDECMGKIRHLHYITCYKS